MHHEHALDIIERYGKHVVVEKPTFMRPSQLDAALAAAERAGVKVFPVFQNRYNKAVARVRAALQNWRARGNPLGFCAAALVPPAALLRHGPVARHIFA